MQKILLNLPGRPSEIWVGSEILKRAGLAFGKEKSPKAFVIADSKLKAHTTKLVRELVHSGWRVKVKFVEATEALKDLKEIYPLYGWLLDQKADRQSVLFAVGGGVIGDAIGFVAGSFLRGIRWVGVPTTLLAQVDSSVGGKTGLNHERGKNLIGSIHQPTQVICDSSFLSSLPDREMVSGLGEMIKYGLVFDAAFFNDLEKDWKEIVSRKSSSLTSAIHRCLQWKARIVKRDELDCLGIREVLNFGHTLGHALEAESGFGYFRHGEAVILGMRVAAHLSVVQGHLPLKTQQRIDRFLGSLPVPEVPRKVRTRDLVARLKWDKKVQEGKVRFVLLKRIGKTVLDRNIRNEDVTLAVDCVRKKK